MGPQHHRVVPVGVQPPPLRRDGIAVPVHLPRGCHENQRPNHRLLDRPAITPKPATVDNPVTPSEPITTAKPVTASNPVIPAKAGIQPPLILSLSKDTRPPLAHHRRLGDTTPVVGQRRQQSGPSVGRSPRRPPARRRTRSSRPTRPPASRIHHRPRHRHPDLPAGPARWSARHPPTYAKSRWTRPAIRSVHRLSSRLIYYSLSARPARRQRHGVSKIPAISICREWLTR